MNISEKETSRVEVFSDGVFVIAITLLILKIKVPHLPNDATNADLLRALFAAWPSFLAFLLSFIAILIMWVNHHGFFKLLRAADSRFLFANGFLLLLIVFVPFPTAVLAEYLDQPSANTAAVFYCGTYVVINIAYNLLWYNAAKNRRLIKPDVSDEHLRKIRNAYLLGFPVYLGACLLAWFSVYVGIIVNLVLWLLWAKLDYQPKSSNEHNHTGARQ